MARRTPKKSRSKSKSKSKSKSRSRKPVQKRATKRKLDKGHTGKFIKHKGQLLELSEAEAAGGGIFSGYKKVRKAARLLRKDPLDALGISRRKFMKTRLGRRLLELSAKSLKRDFGLLDDLIDRFKETRS